MKMLVASANVMIILALKPDVEFLEIFLKHSLSFKSVIYVYCVPFKNKILAFICEHDDLNFK